MVAPVNPGSPRRRRWLKNPFGKRYEARTDSRWHTPFYAAVFADVVRKLAVLQSTKAFLEKHSGSFAKDLSTIAKATDKDCEAFQASLQQAAMQNTSVIGLISAARQHGAVAVQKLSTTCSCAPPARP